VERSNRESKSLKRSVSRRTFFGLLLGAAAAVAGVVSIDTILSEKSALQTVTLATAAPSAAESVPASITTTTGSSTRTSAPLDTSIARVVVVKGTANTDPQVLVDKALEALGGVENLVPAGANILVKPNVGFYAKDPITDPQITAAVVKALKATRPGQIVVGESSLRGVDAGYALQVTGTRNLAEAAGADVKDLTKDPVVSIDIPNGIALKSVEVFKTARDSFIVSVPRLKRHTDTTVTISMKNMMGAVPDSEKGRFHQSNLHQCVADLNSVLRPRLIIIDATKVMTKRGPSGGVMVALNLVIASTDPVAADVVAAQQLFQAEGFSDVSSGVGGIEHIQDAAKIGVGVADVSRIQVLNVNAG
jgi:uncharacterized protein (DUF362 family)